MPKAKRALDAFTAMRVDAILGGHLHRAYIGNSLDVYSGADREHGIAIVQSGTTTSRRGRARERGKELFQCTFALRAHAGSDPLHVLRCGWGFSSHEPAHLLSGRPAACGGGSLGRDRHPVGSGHSCS